MNKKLLAWVSLGVVAAILILWSVLRLSPLGHEHTWASNAVGAALVLLALPIRLYVIFVLGEDGNWSLPVLILLLASSGLMWGLVVERIATVLSSKKSHA